jgi:NAD(P)-dependent dehydrogenase (short-subunit alcohol dehydrogenase family)
MRATGREEAVMQVRDKVWVVTGCGSGMGRELALQLLERGARVAAVDRNPEGLGELAAGAGVGERLSTHVVDITDRAAVEALPAEVETAHGPMDGLINNAGIIQPFTPVADLDDATVQRVLDVNLMGTLYMVRAFLPRMLARPQAHLANVSSMGGYFPFPGQTMYGASKAAVKLLTEGLYAELLDSNVRVSVILPGAVDTGITSNSGVEQPATQGSSSIPVLSAEKAARIMIAGIEKDKLHIYVGPDAKLMSLAIKVAPRAAIRFVQKQMSRRLGTPQAPTVR